MPLRHLHREDIHVEDEKLALQSQCDRGFGQAQESFGHEVFPGLQENLEPERESFLSARSSRCP